MGPRFEFHVQHAAAAIEAGLCDTVLITYGSDLLSRLGRTLGTSGFRQGGRHVGGPSQYEAPYGNTLVGSLRHGRPPAHARVRDHLRAAGGDRRGVREFAGLNPDAMYRDPITVDDVLASRTGGRPARTSSTAA